MDTKKYLQKFMLDNKQSYYFIIAFILMSVVLTILIFSALGMNGQYEREATKIKEQANGLRELLRTQMLQKQSLQKQHSEVLDTIKRVEATFEDQLILIERKRGELAQLQTTIGHQANILPPPTDTPVKKREDALGPGVFMNPQPDLKDVTANRVVGVPAPRTPPSPDEIISTEDKRNAVKEGFLHAWNSYKTYAWGTDELNPLKKTFKNWLDLGVTIVDSLDTLWIMGLHDEFRLARDWIASNLSFEKNRNVSFFETTIRELGGLLSAYEFSRDKVFLDKAEDLGKRLLKAFTDSSPIPFASVNLQNGHGSAPGWTGGASILSEMGTIQLEFLYLAYHTGNPTYAIKPMNVFKHLDSLPKSVEGLYPLYINQATGTFKGNDYSIGALGDSFYEYMVKLWLFTDKQGNGYKRMFQESARGMMSTLVQTSPSGYRYMAQTSRGNIQNKMEHLTCFSGGMFALGAMEDIDPHKADHFQLAADLTETCHESYDRSPTKIGPETFEFRGKDEFIIPSGSSYYILRPEVIESYFVLWRTTHDPKYRRWAWEAFLAIETHCKMEAGYSGIRNVGQIPVVHDDTQQSFFLAETLKYLYLIFSDDDVVPLSDYVFNTEAHPLGKIKLPLREWDQRIRDLILTE